MTDFHDVVVFSWELNWNSLCGHRPAGEKCGWKEFYTLWPWAVLTRSQRLRFTFSSHAFRCISPFPIKPEDSSICYGSISRLPRKRAILCRSEEEPVKEQAVTCSWTVCVRTVAYTARLGQQRPALSLNATCQLLVNCLGLFILVLFVYQTQLNLKDWDLDTKDFILALTCPDTGQFLFSVSAFLWCVQQYYSYRRS